MVKLRSGKRTRPQSVAMCSRSRSRGRSLVRRPRQRPRLDVGDVAMAAAGLLPPRYRTPVRLGIAGARAAANYFRTPPRARRQGRSIAPQSKMVIEAIHGEIKKKSINLVVVRKSKIKHKSVAIIHQNVNHRTGNTVSNEGSQGYYWMGSVATVQQLLNQVSPATADFRYQSSGPWHNWIPGTAIASAGYYDGTTLAPGPYPGGTILSPNNDQRMGLDRIVYNTTISNGSTVPAVATIYCVKHIKDHSLDPTGILNDCLKLMTYGAESKATHATIAAGGTTAGTDGYVDLGFIGTNPYSTKTFSKFCKILNRQTIKFAPGAQYELSYTLHYGKLVNIGDVIESQNTMSNVVACKNIPTVSFFVLWHGGLAVDTNPTGTGNHIPAIAPIQLNMITSYKVYMHIPRPQNTSTYIEQSNVFPNTSGLGNLSVVNVVDAVTTEASNQ